MEQIKFHKNPKKKKRKHKNRKIGEQVFNPHQLTGITVPCGN
jgi:hypothetical protein